VPDVSEITGDLRRHLAGTSSRGAGGSLGSRRIAPERVAAGAGARALLAGDAAVDPFPDGLDDLAVQFFERFRPIASA
jgi:hypothetical protein